MSDTIHVTPINDLRAHADSADCWCEPRILLEGHVTTTEGEDIQAKIVIHHSLDGRERHERQN
jgi:hypothetical protein